MSEQRGESHPRARSRIQVLEPERRPLLRPQFSHEPESEPLYACITNPHSHLPVYTNIHRIRRDIISVVEDYLSLEQLRDVRINISVVRPLVDKLYDLDDISISMCISASPRMDIIHADLLHSPHTLAAPNL
jgi:septum formation topological specificity factor MinE